MTSRLLPLGLALVFLVGCDALIAGMLNGYTGRPPSQEPIVDELAIVRAARPLATDGIKELTLDRLVFLQDDPDSIDRAVFVQLGADQLSAFDSELAVGDTVRFSSTFVFFAEGADGAVPGWKINDYWEPPMGFHEISAITRP